MTKKIIISVLLSIMCVLTGCTSTSDTLPPTIKPTPTTTAKPIHTRGTEKKYEEETYIGNKNSKKFHRYDCWTLPSEENRIEFTSREDAVNSGYSPCGNCQP